MRSALRDPNPSARPPRSRTSHSRAMAEIPLDPRTAPLEANCAIESGYSQLVVAARIFLSPQIQKGLDRNFVKWYKMYHDIAYSIRGPRSASPHRPRKRSDAGGMGRR